MKILLDECVPKKLKLSFTGSEYECFTVYEAGLAGKRNGVLLDAAESRFDLFITLDKGIQYQQNLGGRKISIIVIRTRSNRLVHVLEHLPQCFHAIESIKPGELIVVGK